MRLPDGLGMEILQRIQQDQRSERCVVMTAYGSAENAVEALKAGAFDYLTKPVDLKQFRAVVASAVQQRGSARWCRRRRRRPRLPARATTASATAPRPTVPANAAARRSSGWSATRSRCGWSSRASPRWRAAWRRCWCAANRAPARNWWRAPCMPAASAATGPSSPSTAARFPENLLEAEFFGARKGSYTGSAQDRDGYFQAARGGTLFLDEIGDLPLPMQSKLLRAIQERSVRPIGSTQEDAVDVRIVSATHKDLHAEVQVGRFRQDLFYRLNVIEIPVPPLRDRREDLPALCAALLARIAHDAGMPAPVLSAPLLQQLAAHPLPGNVRELENLLHRAVALGDGEDLQLDLAGGADPARDAARVSDTGAATASAAECEALAPEAAPQPRQAGTLRGAVGPAALSRPARARDPGPCAARERLQPDRGRGPAGPEPAADPLQDCTAGHRHAAERRRPWRRHGRLTRRPPAYGAPAGTALPGRCARPTAARARLARAST